MKVNSLKNKRIIFAPAAAGSTPAKRKKLAALKARVLAPKVRSSIAFWPQKSVLTRFGLLRPDWPLSKTASVTLAFALFCAFASGAWAMWRTSATVAAPAAVIINPQNNPEAGGDGQDTLFNTPLDLLKDYVSKITPTVDLLQLRGQKLKTFLAEHNSPLAAESETIAEQPHWKLILAISFAESTLGQRCYNNNCSGIGGSQIKTYDSVKNWIIDFNNLIDRRYSDWTLEQMCGVYVKPCSSNWLLATRQILDELQAEGIY